MKKAKRILSLVLTLLMLFSMSMVATSAYTAPDGFAVADKEGNDKTDINGEVYGLIGDADLSESINVRDATLIQKHAAELVVLEELQLILSDVNFDGNVNVKDATPIQKWVADLDTLEPINKLIYAPVPDTSAPVEETTAAPETSAPVEETTAAPETSDPAEETTAAPETSDPAEETTAAPETSAPAEETTAAPETSDPAEETTAAPETSTPVEDTTAAPETSAPAQESTAAPDTTVVDDGMVTIYFTNSENWKDAYIYAFYGVEDEPATGEPLGAYPGTKMIYVETNGMGQDIYSAEVPADIDFIKFSDGDNKGTNNRTNNIPNSKIAENAGFYISDLISGTKWDYGTYTYIPSTPDTTAAPETSVPAEETTAAPETSAPAQDTTAAPETSAPVQESTAADSDTITVYFTNNWAFLTQNAYWWGSAGENPQWPGVKMTYVDTNSNGQDIFSAVIPADATGLIFNGEHDQQPGTIRQTVDITEFENGEGFYCDTENSEGKILVGTYTFVPPTPDTTAAPETSAPAEDTTAAPETSAPAPESTAAPETSTPVEESTAAPETSAPAQESTAAPETSTPVEESTAAPETSAPAQESTAAPETSTPVEESTAAPETSAPAEDTTVADSDTITVYFTNNWAFLTQNAYWWGSAGENPQWPGVKMTYVDTNSNGQDIFSAVIPADATGLIFNGEHDQQPGTIRQTVDITEFENGEGFYCDTENSEGKILVGTYTFVPPTPDTTAAPETSAPAEDTTAAPETSAPAQESTAAPETSAPAQESTAAPETSAPAEDTTAAPETSTPVEESTAAPETSAPITEPEGFTVYAINSAKWDVISAYYWGGSTVAWPGTVMTKTEDTVNGFDVYSITLDVAPENIIFNNNNNGSQTADLTFQAGQYFDVKTGKWYTSLDEVPEVSKLSTDRYLVGSFNGWSTVANEFTVTAEDDKIAYVEMELEANTTYEFKIVREGKWTSCKTTLTITDSSEGLTFSSSVSDNTKLVTKNAGVYVFAFGIDTSQLSVTYPG